MKRTTGWIGGAIAVVVALCCGGVFIFPIMFGGSGGWCSGLSLDTSVEVDGWDTTQIGYAAAIVNAGIEGEVPPRGWVIALATAMQESGLKMYANEAVPESLDYPHDAVGSDHDSIGLFQQRPSWGTVAELMDPAISAQKFYDALLEVDGWEDMALTEAAQRVQRSAFPDAYAKWQEAATLLAEAITGAGGAALAAADCAAAAENGEVAPDAWIAPVDAPVWSGFQDPRRDSHYGVDLGAERGAPILAAATGIVRYSECNSPTCDIDGSPEMSGCGWMTVIDHGLADDPYGYWDGVSTRYCHMDSAPFVEAGERVWAGQIIGVVGTTGSSSGPHLHFELHQGGTGADDGSGRLGNESAVDPEPWMREHGAELG
jgi:murein DD-endopeptidase MepM/ murein hydrolase activator NlpD